MKRMVKTLFALLSFFASTWIGNYFYDSTKNTPVLKYLTGVLNWLYDITIAIFNFPIKVWVLLIATFIVSTFIYSYKRFKKPALPKFYNYRKDILKNWIWKWDYKFNGNEWHPINLTAYCPNDDVKLIMGSGVIWAKCPKCEMEFPHELIPYELSGEIRILIQDKIIKGTFPKN